MRQPPDDLRPWFQTIDDLPGPIRWPEFFSNKNPVEIDVGCGRGLFLVNAGQMHPERNFLGIEIDYKEARRAARRLVKRESANVRIIGGDARVLLTKYVRPHSVSAVHVYFPDPWWKRKHKRRRLFNDEFVNIASQVLRPGGVLHSWTDVEDYFEVIAALMDHHPDFIRLADPPERSPQHDLDYQTSFERKKRKEGETIWRGQWRRKPLPPRKSS